MIKTQPAPLAAPDKLLTESEQSPPPAVIQTTRFLRQHEVWHQLSRNKEAFSCRDAARKRWRLGHEGIELWNELKSYFGRFSNANGRDQFFIAHCRADRTVDLKRLGKAMRAQSQPERLSDEELHRFELRYGLVNPFETWRPLVFAMDGPLLAAPVLQVFDSDLQVPCGTPGTVFTNAGDLTWAVEFDVVSLIRRLDHVIIDNIVESIGKDRSISRGALRRRKIGIITGNPPEAGLQLWTDLNRHIRNLLGPLSCGDVTMPPVAAYSLPTLGLTMELETREAEIWPILRNATIEACGSGVRILAIACHTTHFFTLRLRRICEEYGAEFISMPEVLGEWLKLHDIREIALAGIHYVSDLDSWSAYQEPLQELKVEQPSKRGKHLLERLAYRVKSEGPSERGLNRLRDILQQEVDSSTVVLALTELSILLKLQRKKSRSGRLLIDPLALYAEAIAHRYLGLPFGLAENE